MAINRQNMLRQTLICIFAVSALFIQCKKDSNSTPLQLKDTVITGTVRVFDQYGMPVQPTPTVQISAWLTDTVGRVTGKQRTAYTNEEGLYRMDSVAVGIYSIRYSATGYGDFIQTDVRFDSLGGVGMPEVSLTCFAAGSVRINGIELSPKSPDSGYGNSTIANIDRDITFGTGAFAPYQLKVRYFFGTDSSVLRGNCLFSYISGAVEGMNGEVESQIVKFGLPNLKTYFKDSTLIYVAAAVETIPSQIYSNGSKIIYPNIAFPLANYKTIEFNLNADE